MNTLTRLVSPVRLFSGLAIAAIAFYSHFGLKDSSASAAAWKPEQTLRFAGYLWDEEQPAPYKRKKEGDRILRAEEKSQIPDKQIEKNPIRENSLEGSPQDRQLARFLWDEEMPGSYTKDLPSERFLNAEENVDLEKPELLEGEEQEASPDNDEQQQLARFDWGNERESVNASLQMAHFLWGEDSLLPFQVERPERAGLKEAAGTEPPRQESGKPQEDKESSLESDKQKQLARFLWDENEDSGAPTVKLAGFLWDEETPLHRLPARFNDYQLGIDIYRRVDEQIEFDQKDPNLDDGSYQIARFLWDNEEGEGVSPLTLAGFVWDEEATGFNRASKFNALPIESRLGIDIHSFPKGSEDADGATENEHQNTRVLWDAEERDIESRHLARVLWDEDEYQLPEAEAVSYVVTGSNIDVVKTALAKIDAEVTHELGLINAAGARLTDQQVRSLQADPGIRQIFKDGGVKTALAKIDAEVTHEPGLINAAGARLTDRQGRSLRADPGIRQVFRDGGVRTALARIDAEVTREPGLINAAGARLTDRQGRSLRADPGIRQVFRDGRVKMALAHGNDKSGRKKKSFDSIFPSFIDADLLHQSGVTGKGIGIAVIDSGMWKQQNLVKNTRGEVRLISYYDAIENELLDVGKRKKDWREISDEHGHGTHITSVMANSSESRNSNGHKTGGYNGIAPDANLVVVKALNEEGKGTYLDVIRGIAYVVSNRERLNIRVLNISFGATPLSHYWQDPMNQAVMAAWDAGIVVVVSSGNRGPAPMTIAAPGNVPYVVTVGAVTDNYTPLDRSDDYLATFSSAGPTLEGFVKPEIVAPGGHMAGVMHRKTVLAKEHPEFHYQDIYFEMSGTSQAAAVTSGVAALMLQENPQLTPDEVKCRLMASASAATNHDGSLAYSVFQQGSGLINAYTAVHGQGENCLGSSLNLKKDLANEEHYGGPAVQDEDGTYRLSNSDAEFTWVVLDNAKGGYDWQLATLGDESAIWNVGYIWNLTALGENGYTWNQTDFESNGYQWDFNQLTADGFVWDRGIDWDQPFVWDVENLGFFWGYNATVYNLGDWWNYNGSVDNSGTVWDYNGSVENLGTVWDYNGWVGNLGTVWDYNGSVGNLGTVWDYNGWVENLGTVWDYNSSVENLGNIWEYNGVVENLGAIWDYNAYVENQRWVGQE